MRQAVLTGPTPSRPSTTSGSGTRPTPSQTLLDDEVAQMERWCEGMMESGRWDEDVWMSDAELREAVVGKKDRKGKGRQRDYSDEEIDPREIRKPSKSGWGSGKLIAIDDEHEKPGFFDD